MKKNNHLLSLLLIMALTSLNAGAQNLFSPITRSHYDSWGKYIDKYYSKSADVNLIMPSDMMISPSILISGVLQFIYQKGCNILFYKRMLSLFKMKCSSG